MNPWIRYLIKWYYTGELLHNGRLQRIYAK